MLERGGTTNFIDEEAELNVDAGEVEQAYPLALALQGRLQGNCKRS